MTLDDLINIYRAQFPLMREYERDTWYDRRVAASSSRTAKALGNVGPCAQEGEQRHVRYALAGKMCRDMKSGTVDVVIDDDTMPNGPGQADHHLRGALRPL